MRQHVTTARLTGVLVLAAGLAVGLAGCGKGIKEDFAKAPEDRPLEIPPPLDAAAAAPAAPASVMRPAAAPAAAAAGFRVPGERDAVYARVGELLEGIAGLQVVSRAQLLGSYDVTYQGSSFLVRVVGVDNGAQVSAVDARGQQAAGEGPRAVLEALQAGLVR